MAWKYVMLSMKMSSDGIEYNLPVIFPDKFSHKDVADLLAQQLKKDVPKAEIGVASAGFVSGLEIDTVYGKSKTLDVEIRPEDERIIALMDYAHGIV